MTETQAPAKPSVSLWPREHGAYAQLALPLVTAIGIARPSLATFGFAVCSTSAFLAHEPALILLGRRGERARHELRTPARRRLAVLAALALTGGLLGLRGADLEMLIACAIVALCVAASALSVFLKREKTLPGELFAAMTLSVAAVPVVLASGAEWTTALINTGVWGMVFVLGTLTVHGVLRRAKGGSNALFVIAGAIAVTFSVGAIGATAWMRFVWSIALLPPALVTLGVVLLRTTPRHLRRLGWSMVAADMVALFVLLIALRLF